MKTRILIQAFIFALALGGFVGCAAKTDRTERDQKQEDARKPIAEQGVRIAPGHCRIIGTLTFIDTTLEETGPCSKAPCRAIVRVDSILGYGSAFSNPVAMKAQVAVRFAFTLSPTTTELFPNMTERLPGLQVGSKLQTDIESRQEMGTTGNRPTYLIYNYRKLN